MKILTLSFTEETQSHTEPMKNILNSVVLWASPSSSV